MATLVTEGTVRAVWMLTAFADTLNLKKLTAFLAVLSVVAIVSSTFRALHLRTPSWQIAVYDRYAGMSSLAGLYFMADSAVACLGQCKVWN